ncbi:hypothetical protein V6Z11_D02G112500 [Gossypium hirsutum]
MKIIRVKSQMKPISTLVNWRMKLKFTCLTSKGPRQLGRVECSWTLAWGYNSLSSSWSLLCIIPRLHFFPSTSSLSPLYVVPQNN